MIGIIPAAGRGTRLHELGKYYPKALLPYKEKPLLYWNIKTLREAGCEKIYVVINHEKEKFFEFDSLFDFGVEFIVQESLTGLSGAILSALEQVKNKKDHSCLVVLGDLIVSNLEIINRKKNQLSVFQVNDFERWCMVGETNGKVKFFDKSKVKPPTDLALSGVYYFASCFTLHRAIKKQFLEGITINGEYQLSGAMENLPEKFYLDKESKVKDFGTLHNYLLNREVKNSRSFNLLTRRENGWIKKSSIHNANKIFSELSWYLSIPKSIQTYTPKVFNSQSGKPEYDVEYISFPTLREIYLFLDQTEDTWNKIFTKVFEVKEVFEENWINSSPSDELISKFNSRVNSIPKEIKSIFKSYKFDPNDILIDLRSMSAELDKKSYLIHGDLCFSNMLFDIGTNNLKLIDPRGQLYGSKYYDWAKLTHSVIYEYDFIDAELYVRNSSETKIFSFGTSKVKDLYMQKLNQKLSPREIYYVLLLTSSLFITMIPLHYHSTTNQILFAEKAIQIYAEASDYIGTI